MDENKEIYLTLYVYDRYTYSVGSYLWDYLLISPLITELIYPPLYMCTIFGDGLHFS